MYLRRQLLAAGLVVAVLALPAGAWRHAVPVQAAMPPNQPASVVVAGASRPVYLPLVTRTAHVAHDLDPREVEFVQGVSMDDAYRVYVAGRSTLVRLFVDATGGGLDGVTARLTLYRAGELLGQIQAGPVTLAASAAGEGDFGQTLNFRLPAEWVTPDAAYVFELDPHNAIAESDETNNRYPAHGTLSFPLIELAPLEVVLVPVTYARPGGTVTSPPLDDLSYLTWMPSRVMPLSTIDYSVRPVPLVFTGDLRTPEGWGALLAAVDAVRAAEDLTWNKVYYGLVDTSAEACGMGCYSGLGYVNSAGRTVYKAAVGFAGFAADRAAASPVFTHELGHVFGRRHAPCAGARNPDSGYPYTGAAIGHWGYDVTTGEIKPPEYKDYMSYCGPTWTSDYTFHGIAAAWAWLNDPFDGGASPGASGADWLVIAGRIGSDGAVAVQPAFYGSAPAPTGSATHRLEVVDAQGRVLSTTPFAPTELVLEPAWTDRHPEADLAPVTPAAAFRVAVRPVAGMAGIRLYAGDQLVYERMASGPAPAVASISQIPLSSGGLGLSWKAGGFHYRVRFSPDGGETWYLLASDTQTPAVAVPPALLTGASAPLLEVEASDGVRCEKVVYLASSAPS